MHSQCLGSVWFESRDGMDILFYSFGVRRIQVSSHTDGLPAAIWLRTFNTSLLADRPSWSLFGIPLPLLTAFAPSRAPNAAPRWQFSPVKIYQSTNMYRKQRSQEKSMDISYNLELTGKLVLLILFLYIQVVTTMATCPSLSGQQWKSFWGKELVIT